MLSNYPSCNIQLILKFYVGFKYTRAVPSAVLQKMGGGGGGGQWGKILMMRIKIGWSSVRGAGTLSFMGGLIFRG